MPITLPIPKSRFQLTKRHFDWISLRRWRNKNAVLAMYAQGCADMLEFVQGKRSEPPHVTLWRYENMLTAANAPAEERPAIADP